MSQAEPAFYETDVYHTLPVDEAGELARFSVGGGPGYSRVSLVELDIQHDGDPAAYSIEFGGQDADDPDVIHWNGDLSEYSYSTSESATDSWQQAYRYIRVMVTEPAPEGSEARVYVAYGRYH